MPRVTISGSIFDCLRGLQVGDEFSNEAVYGWCDGCDLHYYYTTADSILQLLRLNGYIERLNTLPCEKRKYRVEYKLVREIPQNFTYSRLIIINEKRKNNEKRIATQNSKRETV